MTLDVAVWRTRLNASFWPLTLVTADDATQWRHFALYEDQGDWRAAVADYGRRRSPLLLAWQHAMPGGRVAGRVSLDTLNMTTIMGI